MYSKDTDNYDIGRIDIYIRLKKKPFKSDNKNEFKFKHLTVLGFKARSRFGSSLAKLGDTNDDGYNGKYIAHLKSTQSDLIHIFN